MYTVHEDMEIWLQYAYLDKIWNENYPFKI